MASGRPLSKEDKIASSQSMDTPATASSETKSCCSTDKIDCGCHVIFFLSISLHVRSGLWRRDRKFISMVIVRRVGDSSKCGCAPGACSCTGCKKNADASCGCKNGCSCGESCTCGKACPFFLHLPFWRSDAAKALLSFDVAMIVMAC